MYRLPRPKHWLFVCTFLVLSCIGCKKQASHSTLQHKLSTQSKVAGYPVRVRDERGRTLTIQRPPQRIVVGGTPLYTEIVLDLQARKRLVGITQSSNNPQEARGIPRIGRSWPLNVERVLGLNPDLVLCALGSARKKLEKDAQINVFTGGSKGGGITSLNDLYTLIQHIDLILHGHTQRSKKIQQSLRSQIQKAQASLQSRKPVSAAIIYMNKKRASTFYFVGGKGSVASDLLRRAKGRNVFEQQAGGMSGIETLLKLDPTVIITDPKQKKYIEHHTALVHLRAIRSKRIVGIPASQYTSTRVLRVYKQLIRALHPQHTVP